MDSDLRPESIGEQLGLEAVERVVALAEAYCDCEQRRIALTNQPRINAARAELAICADEVEELEARRRQAERPSDRRAKRRRALYYWTIALTLVFAGFFFSLIAFEPYRLGWKGYLYCVGAAMVTPFCVERFLEIWDCRRLIKAVTTVAFAGALTSLTLLAVIRGDVLFHEVQQAPAVEIESDSAAPAQPQNSFYQDTQLLLRLTLALLAIAMELGAGLALYDARRLGVGTGEDYEKLSRELCETKQKMAGLLYESGMLTNEAAVFGARFWRNFYRAMLTHTLRNAVTKLFPVLLLVFVPLLCHAQVSSAEHLNLVIALDLSSSVAAQGHDGATEFQKNVQAIARLLGEVPAGSRITVLGITENSFSEPYVLLSAKVGSDPGYFGEKLAAARQQLVKTWQARSAHLAPSACGTDILGALIVAGEMFKQVPSPGRNVLIIYSDMRNYTRALDLERGAMIHTNAALAKLAANDLLADLKGAEVFALGVDAAGQDVAQWSALREFWSAYFSKAGAELKNYSIARELPQVGS
jgi:hypothetical protein